MIVIPMAGESSRFKQAGYNQPKFMLPLSERPIFDWALLSFQHYFEEESFVFIGRKSEAIYKFLRQRVAYLGIKKAHFILIDAPTRGQAETVNLGLTLLKKQGIVFHCEPLTIFNIDTIRPKFRLPKDHKKFGCLEVARLKGDHWSFVLPDDGERKFVKKCTEKIRVSDLCCTGMYSFLDFNQFTRAYLMELNNLSSHELFIAPIFNHLISNGEAVSWYEVDASEVLLSGTPMEYVNLNSVNIERYFS